MKGKLTYAIFDIQLVDQSKALALHLAFSPPKYPEERPRSRHESSSSIATNRFVIAIWNYDLKWRIRDANLSCLNL